MAGGRSLLRVGAVGVGGDVVELADVWVVLGVDHEAPAAAELRDARLRGDLAAGGGPVVILREGVPLVEEERGRKEVVRERGGVEAPQLGDALLHLLGAVPAVRAVDGRTPSEELAVFKKLRDLGARHDAVEAEGGQLVRVVRDLADRARPGVPAHGDDVLAAEIIGGAIGRLRGGSG